MRYGSETWNNQEQAKRTKLERYGDQNYNNSEKSKKTCLDRYGVLTVFALDEHKPKPISKLNIRVFHILNQANIRFQSEFPLFFADNIHYRSYDIRINNTLIELQGVFWHANPAKYKANDILHMPKGKTYKAQDIWSKDEEKRQLAIENGYNVIYLFESQMKQMSDADILTFIQTNLKKR